MAYYPTTIPGPVKVQHTPKPRVSTPKLPGNADYVARERDYAGTMDVEFFLTAAQAAIFYTWWKDDLVQGGMWFNANWPALRPGFLTLQFLGDPTFTHVYDGAHRISATVQVRGASLEVAGCEPNWLVVTAPTTGLFAGRIVRSGSALVVLGFANTGAFASYLYRSTDNGRTWTASLQFSNAEYRIGAVSPDRIVYVSGNSVTSSASAVSTSDGLVFSHNLSMPSSSFWYGLAYGGGKFLAGQFASGTIAESIDGVSWASRATPMPGVDCVAYGNGTFVAGHRNSTNIWRSADGGVTWASQNVPTAAPVFASFTNGKFFLSDNAGFSSTGLRHSADGVVWTTVTLPIAVSSVVNMVYAQSHYVTAVRTATGSAVLASKDLLVWRVFNRPPGLSASPMPDFEIAPDGDTIVVTDFAAGKAGLVSLRGLLCSPV